MKMHLQNLFYLVKQLGMMILGNGVAFVDTIFEALASDKSFLETFNFLRSHAIRCDQQNKEENAR
jgi:hypothetical protein